MKKTSFLLGIMLCCSLGSFSQGEIRLSLNDALNLAQKQSLQALLNKYSYMADYWAYRSYLADMLPAVSLRANPLVYSNASELRYNWETQSDEYVRTENLLSDLNLSITQKVAATGGAFSIQSELGRVENFGKNSYTQYSSRPFRLGYQQQLFGYNDLKWQRKIEPLEFEKAKKDYLQSSETMNLTAIRYFFSLINASIQLEMAKTNLENSDKLLVVAQRRFELGTVTREELLDLRLANNNARISVQEWEMYQREAKESLLNLLMLPLDIELDIVIPDELPVHEVDPQLVLQKALENNPEMLELELNILQQQSNVDRANRVRHFQADVSLSYGLSKDDGSYLGSGTLGEVYRPEFDTYKQVAVGINIPILDWGRNKGRYEMARSQLEIAQVAASQSLQQFKQNAITRAVAFNIQKSRVESAALSDTLANESYELTMTRFSSGQADVLRLTSSQKAKDSARLQYISTLSDYWINLYTLRQMTLFDFETNNDLVFEEGKVLQH